MGTSDTGTINSIDLARWREQLRKSLKFYKNYWVFSTRSGQVVIYGVLWLSVAALITLSAFSSLEQNNVFHYWVIAAVIYVTVHLALTIQSFCIEGKRIKSRLEESPFIDELINAGPVVQELDYTEGFSKKKAGFTRAEFCKITSKLNEYLDIPQTSQEVLSLSKIKIVLTVVIIGILGSAFIVGRSNDIRSQIDVLTGLILLWGMLSFTKEEVIWPTELSKIALPRLDQIEKWEREHPTVYAEAVSDSKSGSGE